jgi:hypothetical protein
MMIRYMPLYVLFAAIAVLSSGCAVALVGAGAAGTVAYLKGDLESVEPHSVEQVFIASKKAIDALGMHLWAESRDTLTARLVTRDAQDNKITIKIDHMTHRTTKLRIRVSTFGDEIRSQEIYLKIRQYL